MHLDKYIRDLPLKINFYIDAIICPTQKIKRDQLLMMIPNTCVFTCFKLPFGALTSQLLIWSLF